LIEKWEDYLTDKWTTNERTREWVIGPGNTSVSERYAILVINVHLIAVGYSCSKLLCIYKAR
jgi:hypothetical protein